MEVHISLMANEINSLVFTCYRHAGNLQKARQRALKKLRNSIRQNRNNLDRLLLKIDSAAAANRVTNSSSSLQLQTSQEGEDFSSNAWTSNAGTQDMEGRSS